MCAVFASLFCTMIQRLPISPLFPYTTLFRSRSRDDARPGTAAELGRDRRGRRHRSARAPPRRVDHRPRMAPGEMERRAVRSEEHTSELQSRENLVCRLLLEKKKKKISTKWYH